MTAAERIPTNRGVVAMRKAWKATPADTVRAACAHAGVGYEHFKHCAAGRKRMGPDSASAFLSYLHNKGFWKEVRLEELILPRVKRPKVTSPSA